jgi:hypothetical protein
MAFPGGCPSGQRERSVKSPAYAYGGSNPPPPTHQPAEGCAQNWGPGVSELALELDARDPGDVEWLLMISRAIPTTDLL